MTTENTENDYHFAIGHPCAGCIFATKWHKDCFMLKVKKIQPKTTGKPEQIPNLQNLQKWIKPV